MQTNSATTIHVDYEINRRDLFRVNLDLDKWRLVIGLVVSAIPVVAGAYFFMLIDEKKMLLQLSPLLAGAPFVAVGGQVLRLHALCRKFVSSLPESQRRVQYFFQPETDGFDVTQGESFGHVAWTDVSKAIEKPAYFVLYRNRFDATIIPKDGFHSRAEVPTLRDVLRAKLGQRAELLNQ
ncbi:MAG TPA: YcxB family protein [Pyrinomonadaceae bacterium]|jgi:hypothetical protein